MISPPRSFAQIDVFTAQSGMGNPVAVVLDSAGLSDDAMQRFARWTNLSETTFVLPPTDARADYRLRIFAPGGELPFAGHPTLGSCHAWLAAGGAPKSPERIVQQCAKGLIDIRRDGERLAFAAPPSKYGEPLPAVLAQVVQAIGVNTAHILRAQVLDNGPVFMALQLDSASTVLALEPDHARLARLKQNVGVVGRYSSGQTRLPSTQSNHTAGTGEPLVEVRAFVPLMDINEDPITGSLNASLAQWLIEAGELPSRYVAAQGTVLGRAGRVHVERDAHGQVWVGGDSVTVVRGEVML
ncbi:MAG: PhzF family phenazine biosynthesis protein [Azonexus sp.]|jgi:PhzF family phenazine biosynthesis protein|uniref:PhzF family phenazine biosynthesis protein n=1 Tax=Azonexus sp. TaxID=1872668 RepID=UPI002831011C|nr:PhzF family phenazine biosynthesis protein [Azonexus sp.]MDR0776863.1 PhzF family phenazine biosynthesis protein [Azonexus sp.]